MKTAVFTAISVLWFSLGMGLIISPAWFVEILERLVSDEFRLFVLLQLEMIVNLALLVGTTDFAFRAVWLVVGSIGVAKTLFLIWSRIGKREAFLDWWFKRPFWQYRAWGAGFVGLATVLAYGLINF